MWNLPGPGLEPVSPALTGGFLNHCATREVPPNHVYFINLLIYLLAVLLRTGFLQLRRAGATFRCAVQASHCGGFSHCGAQVLGTRASVVVARGLSSCGSWDPECRFSSCGARASLLRGMWDLPGPGLEPVSPALAGGFLTTAPPGKSLAICFLRPQQYPRKLSLRL